MTEPEDHELLAAYARARSEAAFAALVARYVNLVYSAAWRFTRNPQHAEEIAQAVFIILARKAAGLGRSVVLSGWLYQTARFTAANFVKREIRRQRNEQEAYMQSTLIEPESADWEQIAPLLDEAMGRLGETDRNAVVLRFFENKTPPQVAAALKMNEDAARKRVNRAVEKLRKYFAKRGVKSTTATITGAVSAHSVLIAPAALVKSVTIAATTTGAAVSGSSVALVKTTLIAMKTKTIVITSVAAALLVGTGAYLGIRVLAHRTSEAAEVVPIKFANDDFSEGITGSLMNMGRFVVEYDPNTRRTEGSAPALHIKSLINIKVSSSDSFYHPNPKAKPVWASGSAFYPVTKKSLLYGKRIRISGWIKSSNVVNWAGAACAVDNLAGHCFAFGDSTSRPIHGTEDWQEIDFVTDVPKEPCSIYFAPTLFGSGEIWCDNFHIDVVSSFTPLDDDRAWRYLGPNPADYTINTDSDNPHFGHSPLCITYAPEGNAVPGTHMWWGHCLRQPDFDKFKGHTVHMTVWTKLEDVTGGLRPTIDPTDARYKRNTQDKLLDKNPLHGTTDWIQHIVTCRIPKETETIDTGFNFWGGGKVWIDMDSLKYEVVK